MNFNSYSFFFFLGIVLILYRLLPWKAGRRILVLASYFFYGNANPWYCILLFTSTIVDYYIAQKIHSTANKKQRTQFLLLSIIINIGLLSIFKYGDFFISNFNWLFGFFNLEIPFLNLILPVGISFYTFQTLSYTVDVYRKHSKPCKDFFTFALFVGYFPQLVAGPIERAKNLIPQLIEKKQMYSKDIMHGIERILWGLIKKTVFADRLAVFVNEVYYDPAHMSSPIILLAIFAFMLQLYLDFSAYTDIAIGIARIMGVKLSENFNYPFLARNPSEFWSKWHMTLTHWFRDYVFKPLGGIQRKKYTKTMFNGIFMLTLIGFWHGANWNFVLFGFISGLSLITHQTLRIFIRKKNTGPVLGTRWYSKPLAIILVAPALYLTGVLFRTPDMQTAWTMFCGIFSQNWYIDPIYLPYIYSIIFIFILHIVRAQFIPKLRTGTLQFNYNRIYTNFILLLFLIFTSYEYKETFIYFQF
jgi:alginate O-acetyltransferase complex protein AlgI